MCNEIFVNLLHIGHNHQQYYRHYPQVKQETTECEICYKLLSYQSFRLSNIQTDIALISAVFFVIFIGKIFNYVLKYITLISLKVKFSN